MIKEQQSSIFEIEFGINDMSSDSFMRASTKGINNGMGAH